jgi:plastocyanin
MPRPLPALCATLAACTAAAAAHAAPLQISVNGADGKPAADTVVLVRRAASFQPFDRSEPVVVAQKDIRFLPSVSVVPVRGTVRFVNRDRFAHHVRSMPVGPLGSAPPAADFEFRLAAARGSNEPAAEVTLDNPGPIGLGCHLHGSMRGHLYVSNTPWYGVTDSQGKVTIDVPDGAAELQLWHPDQLVEQPVRALQVAGAMAQSVPLNFSPRPRPTPRPAAPDEYRY